MVDPVSRDRMVEEVLSAAIVYLKKDNTILFILRLPVRLTV